MPAGYAVGREPKAFPAQCWQTRLPVRNAVRDNADEIMPMALRNSNEHLRALIDAVLAGIVIVDHDGVIQDLNPAAERMFGPRAGELVGRSAGVILPGVELPGEAPLAQTGEPGRIVLGKRKDGSSVLLELLLSEMRVDGQRYFVLLVNDVSAHTRAETRLRYRLELESAVAEVSHRFLHADDASLDAVIDLALERMSALPGVDRGYLFLLSEDGATLSNTHEWCAEGIAPQIQDLGAIDAGEVGDVLGPLERGDVLHVPSVADLPDTEQPLKSFLVAGDIQSCIFAPLSWNGRLRGFIGFDAVRARKTFAEEDIRLLRTVAEIMGRAMASREAARRIADEVWFRENLDRVAFLFSRARDLDDLLNELAGLLLEIFAADRAWLAYPCNPDAAIMRVPIEVTRPEYPGAFADQAEIPVDEAIRAQVRATLASPEPLVVDLAAMDEPPAVSVRYGVKTMMVTAVRPRNEEAWLMGLHQCSHARQWSARERRLYQAIAERASEALLLHVVNQKLRVSESRLAFVLESNPGVLYAARLGHPAICTYISPSIQRILGYAPEEVTSTPGWLGSVLHPDDVERTWAQFDAQRERAGRAMVNYRIRKKDGEYLWVQDQQTFVSGGSEHGELIGCLMDLTQQLLAEQELERARAAAEEALATAEKRLRMLEMAEEVAHFGHWRVDLATGAVSWSKELFRIHGLPPGAESKPPDMMGTIDSYYPRDKDLLLGALALAMAEKRVVVSEAELVLPDGTRRWLQTHSAPELDAHENVTAMFGVTHDVTQRKRDEQELVRAREEALEASRVKSQFLANMSHEIRTPLNGVLGLTALLLDSELSAEQRELLEMVRTAGRTLHELIEGVLDISKIEAGKLELEAVPFPLCDVVQEAARTVAVRAHEKGLELVVDLAPDLPARVIGDPVRFRQILTNLLANAVKFTPAGEIELTVRRDTASNILVAVRDTGIGVPAERRDAIFEAFTQADGSTTREYGGTGLGLAICSELVERMGGRIWVEPAPGGGSVFRFFVALPAADGHGDREDQAVAPSLVGARVLVVDDNQATGRVLASLLGSWRMEPVVCTAVHEALAAVHHAAEMDRPFRLALIDATLGHAGGIELAATLARDPRFRAMTRILLVHASFRPEPDLLGDGIVSRCLLKPVSPSTLLDALLLGSGPASVPVRLPAGSVLQPGLHVLLAEDNPMNALLIKRILARSACTVVHVTTGAAALAAWDRQRFDVILMDMQMPEIDGLEATRRIRAQEAQLGGHTPIIALTANALKEDEQRCRDAGMDDYLAKPIEIDRFLQVLARIEPARRTQTAQTAQATNAQQTGQMEQPEQPEQPGQAAQAAQQAATHRHPFDAGALFEQLGNDREIVETVVATFLDTQHALLRDIEAAFAAGDLGALERAAHHARGSLVVLQAQPAAAASLAIEMAARNGERHWLGPAMAELRDAWSQLVIALDAARLVSA
jgi:two-component system sensor histidine kinase/response regulator